MSPLATMPSLIPESGQEQAMMWGGDWGWGGWLGMGLGMVAFWGLVVWGIVTLVRGRGEREAPRPRPSAQQLLAERLAQGEIDVEEYQGRLEVLRGGERTRAQAP
jgi:putative membrane protein